MIRAIAGALNISWSEASDLLYSVARELGCEMSCIGCYSSLFSDLGLFEVDVRNLSVGEVLDKYPNDVIIIRIQGHLTCGKNGELYDIWDCRFEKADRAWIINW